MHLLCTNAVPLQLKEVREDEIKSGEIKYVILSHRWGDDETSFQDLACLEQNRLKGTKGYKKIQCFLKRAAKEGYDYAWIDTCCINKESSAELSEAINSMFRWYQLADICYAYLQDVHPSKSPEDINTQLQKSEWFQRGWTLQELIAPPSLVFLSNDWTNLGDKTGLSQLISKITLIDEGVLRGETRLGDCSVAKRMSWASARVTTRTEDTAYCLMGIFNVSMPLLYGEGRKAFIRLQEEIMKESDDQSLFAWDASDFQGFNATGLLALTPAFFKNSKNIVPFRPLKKSSPYSVTNKGIRVELPLLAIEAGVVWSTSEEITQKKALLLECQELSTDHRTKPVAILLGQLAGSDSRFIRINHGLYRDLAWAHLWFLEPSVIYARKIYWDFEEAVIEPARELNDLNLEVARPQRNIVIFFDDGYYNGFRKGNYSAIQTIHSLISDVGNPQICYYDQPTSDDNIKNRVMRAYEILETIGVYVPYLNTIHDIWSSYQTWYRAVSCGNPDLARGDFSEMSLVHSGNFKLAVTFLGLFDSVNTKPGCNLARGICDFQKEEYLPSIVTHPGLVVRHAVAIDEREPSLRPNLGNESAKYMHDFEELWFPGGHAVVTDSSPNEKWKLGHVPLVWMLREAARAGLGIDPHKLRRYFDLEELNQAQPPKGDEDILKSIFFSEQMKNGLYQAAKLGHMHDYWKFHDRSTTRSILMASTLEEIPLFDISKKRFSSRAIILKKQLFWNIRRGSTVDPILDRSSFLGETELSSHLGQDWVKEFLYFQMRYSSRKRSIPDRLRRSIPNGTACHISVIHRTCSDDSTYRPANPIDASILKGPFLLRGWRIKRQADFIGEYHILGESYDNCNSSRCYSTTLGSLLPKSSVEYEMS
ncbi:unnamed protein product [Aspergillus oryzae]|uniref:Unnamed protein product n=1 Tax=Aspergillus oryzae var. brunneus TaxID=332754 RepID=A0ABQ6L9Q9_ASPOZ|nr:unnamed protein product [Aspergillus oryzae]GMF87756.1 unnamed protein product [Aspergillus oryzae]GMG09679.1 unnamed protein product [Aspergillus oryzae]GMG51810.1 unnamed protein product [Aspergillus oryzae var. brunneus]